MAWSPPTELPPSMLLGVPEIDLEHQAIFAMIQREVTSLRGSKLSPSRSHFDDLLQTIRKHFAHEEQIMADTGYAGLGIHAGYHGDFLRQLSLLLGTYGKSRQQALDANLDALDALLKDAFRGDIEFANWLRETSSGGIVG